MDQPAGSDIKQPQDIRVFPVDGLTAHAPAKELELEEGSTLVYGICEHCKLPIKYPPIKIPGSYGGEQVPNKVFTITQVVYNTFHVSCAFEAILNSQQVDLQVTSSMIFKYNWLDKIAPKLIRTISNKIKIFTYKKSN